MMAMAKGNGNSQFFVLRSSSANIVIMTDSALIIALIIITARFARAARRRRLVSNLMIGRAVRNYSLGLVGRSSSDDPIGLLRAASAPHLLGEPQSESVVDEIVVVPSSSANGI